LLTSEDDLARVSGVHREYAPELRHVSLLQKFDRNRDEIAAQVHVGSVPQKVELAIVDAINAEAAAEVAKEDGLRKANATDLTSLVRAENA